MLFIIFCIFLGGLTSAAFGYETGIFNVSMHVKQGKTKNIFYEDGVAFLVDKKRGIFLYVSSNFSFSPNEQVQAEAFLSHAKGIHIRCSKVVTYYGINFLYVCDEDKGLLQGLHQFDISSSQKELTPCQKVRWIVEKEKLLWDGGEINSFATAAGCVPLVECSGLLRTVVRGSPVLDVETNAIVGALFGGYRATMEMIPGYYLRMLLDSEVENNGNTVRMQWALETVNLGELEENWQRKVTLEQEKSYPLGKVPTLIAWYCNRREGVLLPGDVFLEVAGKKVFSHEGVVRAIWQEWLSGAQSFKAKVMRVGAEQEVEVPLNTRTMRANPQGTITFGPYTFFIFTDLQGEHIVCEKHDVGAFESSEVKKMNGQEIKNLSQVEQILRQSKGGSVDMVLESVSVWSIAIPRDEIRGHFTHHPNRVERLLSFFERIECAEGMEPQKAFVEDVT